MGKPLYKIKRLCIILTLIFMCAIFADWTRPSVICAEKQYIAATGSFVDRSEN